jgi:hypothetical protein
MDTANTLVCITQGHAYRKIIHEGAVFRYCLRCGRVVWQHSHINLAHDETPALARGGAVET